MNDLHMSFICILDEPFRVLWKRSIQIVRSIDDRLESRLNTILDHHRKALMNTARLSEVFNQSLAAITGMFRILRKVFANHNRRIHFHK